MFLPDTVLGVRRLVAAFDSIFSGSVAIFGFVTKSKAMTSHRTPRSTFAVDADAEFTAVNRASTSLT